MWIIFYFLYAYNRIAEKGKGEGEEEEGMEKA